jgi:hypothetical protein
MKHLRKLLKRQRKSPESQKFFQNEMNCELE